MTTGKTRTPVILMPPALEKELSRMRRVAREFTVTSNALCRFCGERNALLLAHPLSENVGLYCTERHGWIFFQSNLVWPVGEHQPKQRRKAA